MSENNLIEILTRVGAVIPNGHFVGTSGLHFATYVNKDALYPHTAETSAVGRMFAEKYKDAAIDVVVGPALGGIILSTWTAHHLSELTGREVLGVYTEKTADKGQAFTRGYEKFVGGGKRVLIVEDIATTGGSVMKVVEVVRAAGGTIAGTCVMVNKDPNVVKLDALLEYPVENYEAAACPLCAQGVPVNTGIGHGKKFLEAQAAQKSSNP